MKKLVLLVVIFASAFALKAQKVSEYTASNGKVYKVNQTLTIGKPSNDGHFTSITNMAMAYANALGGTNEDTEAASFLTGLEVPIKKIKMRKVFGQKRPFVSIGKGYVINLETAIKLKEVE
jgi:hypothetical protein